MLGSHACTLVRARSALATLADQAPTVNASSAFERALIELDRLYGDQSPSIDAHELVSKLPDDFPALLSMATSALEELERYGTDSLSIQFILVTLEDTPNGLALGGA